MEVAKSLAFVMYQFQVEPPKGATHDQLGRLLEGLDFHAEVENVYRLLGGKMEVYISVYPEDGNLPDLFYVHEELYYALGRAGYIDLGKTK